LRRATAALAALPASRLCSMPVSKAQPLIAVVDDEEPNRIALRRLLRAAKFDVEMFPSGAAFLESLKSHQPDCVVLDIHMPGLGGLAVQARLVESGVRLPVIFLTADDSAQIRERALAGGASAYFRKMVDRDTLLDAITTAIAQTPGPDAP